MKRAELNKLAQNVLGAEVRRLSQLSYEEIAQWPEFPAAPSMQLQMPPELAGYQFTLMKDTQPDKSIRVAIQVYRYRFLGMGYMSADGFYMLPNGSLRKFTEQDVWTVT